MPSRERLRALVRSGQSYEQVGHDAGIPPGQAYLIATGLAADGSDALGPEYLEQRADLLQSNSQALVNPPTEVPTEDETVDAWLKRRASADPAMQAAEQLRTAEPPPIEDPSDSDDVIDVLGHQHNQVKYLMEQLEAIPGVRVGGSERDQQRRVSVVDMMRERLSGHETAEEAYFWPAVREHVDGGEDLASQAEDQEQHGKEVLQALTGLDGDDDQFDQLVEELVLALRTHVNFEDTVFLRAKAQIDEQERAELGRKIKTTVEHGPTRPHPHAPAGSKLAAAAAVPLDRARDALGSRPAEREGQAEDEQAQHERAQQEAAEREQAEDESD